MRRFEGLIYDEAANVLESFPRAWDEYDSAADWCARRGLKGESGEALPPDLSAACLRLIYADPEAFAERVRATAYANAREAEPSRERRVIDCRELDKYLGEGWREAKDAMPPLRMAIVER